MNLPELHQAITSGNFEEFSRLIQQGSDVNQLDPIMGNTPLHIAAQQSSTKWVDALLGAGAFINIQTPKHGVTPLMVAVWHRKPHTVERLLSDSDVNIEIVSTFGLRARDLLDFGASEDDQYGKAQAGEMSELFSQYIQRRSEVGQSLLAFKIVSQNESVDEQNVTKLNALTDWSSINGTFPITASGNDEHTAAMVAARDGLTGSLKVIMDNGADQTIPDHYMKAIPLHKAAYNGHADVIEVLSNYAGFEETLNAQGPNNGYTPLHDAVWHGHVTAAKALIEAGAMTDLVGFDGKTPLMLAQEYRYSEIVKLLENK